MRLTDKYECGYEIRTEPHNCGCGELQVPICEDQDVRNKLGQLEDIEDNLPAFNGLQHLFAVIDLMEQDEVLCFTYKGKSFVIERNE